MKDHVEGCPSRKLKAIEQFEVTMIGGRAEQVQEYLQTKKYIRSLSKIYKIGYTSGFFHWVYKYEWNSHIKKLYKLINYNRTESKPIKFMVLG